MAKKETVYSVRDDIEEHLKPERIKESDVVLEVKGLTKFFPIKKGFMQRVVGNVRAVDDVSFYVREGETLGLVGESGCGKTTASRTVIRLYDATAGAAYFKSSSLSTTDEPVIVNLMDLDQEGLKKVRKEMSMIFQDPINSLNPRMSIYDIVAEPMIIHGQVDRKKNEQTVISLLDRVGLRASYLRRYPHEFSGGQRQRIGIARALALNPKIIFCDEPVSALDVSIQAQTLNLLKDLQADFNLSYVFVAHDLSVVQHISDRVAVMYVGKVAEIAESDVLFNNPLHPYTEALLSSVPKPDPKYESKRIHMQGDVADPSNPPSGCYFHPRCQYAEEICRTTAPEYREIKPGHFVSCHRAEELELKGV